MSFLLGAFGKMAASRRVRDLNAQKLRISSRLRRATKQIGVVDKQIARAEQADKNALKAQVNAAKQAAQLNLQSTLGLGNLDGTENGTTLDQTQMAKFNSGLSMISGNADAYYATMEQRISDYYENLRDTQLEPLKQEEDLLQSELEQIDSQIQVAQGELKFCQDMEKNDAKSMTPQYVGGN